MFNLVSLLLLSRKRISLNFIHRPGYPDTIPFSPRGRPRAPPWSLAQSRRLPSQRQSSRREGRIAWYASPTLYDPNPSTGRGGDLAVTQVRFLVNLNIRVCVVLLNLAKLVHIRAKRMICAASDGSDVYIVNPKPSNCYCPLCVVTIKCDVVLVLNHLLAFLDFLVRFDCNRKY
jgi:hypothetical protein